MQRKPSVIPPGEHPLILPRETANPFRDSLRTFFCIIHNIHTSALEAGAEKFLLIRVKDITPFHISLFYMQSNDTDSVFNLNNLCTKDEVEKN